MLGNFKRSLLHSALKHKALAKMPARLSLCTLSSLSCNPPPVMAFKKTTLVFISPRFLPSASPFINSPPKSSTRHKRRNASFQRRWIDLNWRKETLQAAKTNRKWGRTQPKQLLVCVFLPLNQRCQKKLLFVMSLFPLNLFCNPAALIGLSLSDFTPDEKLERSFCFRSKPSRGFLFMPSVVFSSPLFCLIEDKEFLQTYRRHLLSSKLSKTLYVLVFLTGSILLCN